MARRFTPEIDRPEYVDDRSRQVIVLTPPEGAVSVLCFRQLYTVYRDGRSEIKDLDSSVNRSGVVLKDAREKVTLKNHKVITIAEWLETIELFGDKWAAEDEAKRGG